MTELQLLGTGRFCIDAVGANEQSRRRAGMLEQAAEFAAGGTNTAAGIADARVGGNIQRFPHDTGVGTIGKGH